MVIGGGGSGGVGGGDGGGWCLIAKRGGNSRDAGWLLLLLLPLLQGRGGEAGCGAVGLAAEPLLSCPSWTRPSLACNDQGTQRWTLGETHCSGTELRSGDTCVITLRGRLHAHTQLSPLSADLLALVEM